MPAYIRRSVDQFQLLMSAHSLENLSKRLSMSASCASKVYGYHLYSQIAPAAVWPPLYNTKINVRKFMLSFTFEKT